VIKICHITSVHDASDTRIFHKECRSLSLAGFDVTLIATKGTDTTVDSVKRIVLNKTGNRFNRAWNITNSLLKEALATNAEIFHLHDPELLRIAPALKKKNKIVVYDAHEDLPRQIMGKYYIPKPIRKPIAWMAQAFENHFVSQIDAVVAATESIKKRFEKIIPRVIVIHNYPLIEDFIESHTEKSINQGICYIGGIFETRGIVELVNAASIANVTLHLAGSYSPLEFRDRLITLKGWKNVIEYGFVGREKIKEILEKCSIGMVTLHPTPAYIESLPIKLFEYMAAGLPVIASDFDQWKSIIQDADCGLCVNPLDSQEIANAIQFLMEHRDKAQKMGINGKHVARKKYNWSAESEKLIELYHSLNPVN
jgi:glycosyltransferase involved in cell wall biosynthesis